MSDINLTSFSALKESVEKYGISILSQSIKLTKENIEQKEQFEEEGLDIAENLSNVFNTNSNQLFTILGDGSIRKSIIHIVDISNYKEKEEYPKFHIYSCKTIEEMKFQNRFYRYKLSGRNDGKFFLVKKNKKWKETLEICSNCLKLYNDEYETSKTKSNFMVKEYLTTSKDNQIFKNMNLDICTIPDQYTENWKKISDYVKNNNNYECSQCHKNFSSSNLKKFLHTHHIDANRKNNTTENLTPLCIECHSMQFHHSHIKKSPDYKKYISIKNKNKNKKEKE